MDDTCQVLTRALAAGLRDRIAQTAADRVDAAIRIGDYHNAVQILARAVTPLNPASSSVPVTVSEWLDLARAMRACELPYGLRVQGWHGPDVVLRRRAVSKALSLIAFGTGNG